MTARHTLESWLTHALVGAVRAMPWKTSLGLGVRLGDSLRALGLRRTVAAGNLARAFPDWSGAQHHSVLVEHYRELGRVAVEYARLGELVRLHADRMSDGVVGREHLEPFRGRGAILLTGHFGHFELLGAMLGRLNPVDFVVKPLSNRGVEEMLARQRRDAGVGTIPIGAGAKGVFRALRAGRWVAMLADQDARRHGVFVPFFGRLASTPAGPARFALQTGVPIVLGIDERMPDGFHRLTIDPPLVPSGAVTDESVRELTALHTAWLERKIREAPQYWFWLHRRWKTPPPPGGNL